ncbi:hypothetical protein PanWU01x14_009620, partial [Parasponia andersonii]
SKCSYLRLQPNNYPVNCIAYKSKKTEMIQPKELHITIPQFHSLIEYQESMESYNVGIHISISSGKKAYPFFLLLLKWSNKGKILLHYVNADSNEMPIFWGF